MNVKPWYIKLFINKLNFFGRLKGLKTVKLGGFKDHRRLPTMVHSSGQHRLFVPGSTDLPCRQPSRVPHKVPPCPGRGTEGRGRGGGGRAIVHQNPRFKWHISLLRPALSLAPSLLWWPTSRAPCYCSFPLFHHLLALPSFPPSLPPPRAVDLHGYFYRSRRRSLCVWRSEVEFADDIEHWTPPTLSFEILLHLERLLARKNTAFSSKSSFYSTSRTRFVRLWSIENVHRTGSPIVIWELSSDAGFVEELEPLYLLYG